MSSEFKDTPAPPAGARRRKYSVVSTYQSLASSVNDAKSAKSPAKPQSDSPKLRRNGSLRSLPYPGMAVNVSVRSLERHQSLESFQKEIDLRRRDQHVTENMVLEETETDIDKYYVRKKHVLGTGISVVRTCVHKGTGRRFALKTLDKTGLSDTELGRLGEEIRIMAQVDHPYIVRLYESFETPTEIYLVMELLTGGDLLEKLTTQLGSIHNEMLVCKQLQTVLNAVRYIHDHHIVHRDLKLENFLFENEKPDAALKLIDFGFSQRFHPDQVLSAALGTAYYVAPEVLMKSYTYKCDIWSIGVIAYMLLTGSPPFDGASDAEILTAVHGGRYTFDPQLFHGVSEVAKDFVRRCLTYDPDKRPTAEEAQRHPWFLTINITIPRELSHNILHRLKVFKQKTALSRLCLEAVAFALSPEQLTRLREEFMKFDVDNTGCITYEGLRVVLASNGNFTSQEVSEIFTGIDLEGTGEIRYHELMAAMLSRHYQKHENLKLAFDRMAHHKDHITYPDIRDLLGKDYSDEEAEKMLTDLNLNTNAVIKFNDFIEIMRGSHRKKLRRGNRSPRRDGSVSPRRDGSVSPRRDGAVSPRRIDYFSPFKDGATSPRGNGSVSPRNGGVSPRSMRTNPRLSDLFGPPDAPIPANLRGISHLHFKSSSMMSSNGSPPVTLVNVNNNFGTSLKRFTAPDPSANSSSIQVPQSASKSFKPPFSFGASVVGRPSTPKGSHLLAKPSTPARGNRSPRHVSMPSLNAAI